MRNWVLGLTLMLGLAGCGAQTFDADEPVEPIGNFQLGFLAMVAEEPKAVLSRQIPDEVLQGAFEQTFQDWFGRFEGGKLYHLGVKIEQYSVPRGIGGRSAVQLLVTVWDDAAQAKLNAEPEVFQIIRVFESGLERLNMSDEEQLKKLSVAAATELDEWLRTRLAEDGWFTASVEDADAASSDAVESAAAADVVAVE